MNGSFKLIMRRGPNVGKTFELVKDVVTIGRDASNDVAINDAEVSRHHARLTRQGGGYAIEDLGSTNGTFVGSMRLTGLRILNNGDTFGLGETVTLAYEVATADAGATVVGSVSATMVNNLPEPQFAAPPPPAYSPPQADFSSAAPLMDSGTEAQPQAGGSRKWIAIGCGCLTVCLCFAAIAGALAYIDANNLYCQIAPFICP